MPQFPQDTDAPAASSVQATRESFRNFFRLDARSVAVVTACGGNGPTGSTITSYCSLSADPQLLLACLTNRSRTLREILASGRFAFHLLRSDQGHICDLFARLQDDKSGLFNGLSTEIIEEVPVLTATLAWAVCTVRHSHNGGDHTILIGKMLRMACNPGAPLVWQYSRQCEVSVISDPLCG